MGRKSNYSKGIFNNDKKTISLKEVMKKINREPLSADEIAEYLSKKGNYATESETIIVSEASKTVKNHIKAICDNSRGLLKIDDFKKDGIYLFNPKIHGLLLTILDTKAFDGRKKHSIIKNIEDSNKTITKNIDKYLDEVDKDFIKNDPAYLNALVESELSVRFNKILISLIRNLYHADPIIRFALMKHTIEEIARLEKWIRRKNSNIYATKRVYGFEIEENANEIGLNGKYQKEMFEAETLEQYLITLLAHKLHHGKLANSEKTISLETLYTANKIFKLIPYNEDSLHKMIEEVDQAISNNAKFKNIQEKATKILDLNDPYEKLIYLSLIDLAKVYFGLPLSASPKDYNDMIKFIHSVIKKDYLDILREFSDDKAVP